MFTIDEMSGKLMVDLITPKMFSLRKCLIALRFGKEVIHERPEIKQNLIKSLEESMVRNCLKTFE